MAPGGVEPPRTDSKSVALSAELRGPAASVPDRVRPDRVFDAGRAILCSLAVAVAQLVEPRVVVPVVGGSSPLRHPSRLLQIRSAGSAVCPAGANSRGRSKMQARHFVRFGWLGIAIVAALIGRVAGGAAGPGPADLVVAQTPNPGVYGNIIWGMSAIGARDAWAVGGKATASSNDTLALHWNGTSWSAVPTPNPDAQCEDGDIMWAGQALTGVSGVSATDVWAVGG